MEKSCSSAANAAVRVAGANFSDLHALELNYYNPITWDLLLFVNSGEIMQLWRGVHFKVNRYNGIFHEGSFASAEIRCSQSQIVKSK